MSNGPGSTFVCLAVGGLDPSGGAGIIADTRTFAALGCHGAAAITSVTYQNSKSVEGAVHQSPGSVRRQIESVIGEFSVAAVKTGMLPTREIVETVADLISSHKFSNVVIDPVVRSTSGFPLIDEHALKAIIKRLFPLAVLVTPNIPEAELIAGFAIKSQADIEKAAGVLRSMGAANVLIKGGHLPDAFHTGRADHVASDFLFQGENLTVLESEYIESTPVRGTGCMLASAIAASLALGHKLDDAVRQANDLVHNIILSHRQSTTSR
jgi:hydroxymethylpyrimidine/phosphomethylpyrimidine kinase